MSHTNACIRAPRLQQLDFHHAALVVVWQQMTVQDVVAGSCDFHWAWYPSHHRIICQIGQKQCVRPVSYLPAAVGHVVLAWQIHNLEPAATP